MSRLNRNSVTATDFDKFNDMAEAAILIESIINRYYGSLTERGSNPMSFGYGKLRDVQHAIAAEMLEIATTTNILQWIGISI